MEVFENFGSQKQDNDKAWLDGAFHPRSEALHMTERYRRRDFGHIFSSLPEAFFSL